MAIVKHIGNGNFTVSKIGIIISGLGLLLVIGGLIWTAGANSAKTNIGMNSNTADIVTLNSELREVKTTLYSIEKSVTEIKAGQDGLITIVKILLAKSYNI
jgi:hypothetical protein